MTQFFLDRQDELTARKFRPSSMETIRSVGGDPLTLVTEMPLLSSRKWVKLWVLPIQKLYDGKS